MPVASELLVKISADTKDAEQGIARVDKQVSSFAKGASALGGVATAAFAGIGVAAIGLGAGLGSAVKTAADFEHQIAGVGALANASAAQMQQLSDEALRLGQSASLSGIGARDAAQAMQALAAAGFTVDEMTHGVTEGVLLLASATGSTVANAATIAGDAFGEFRKSMGLTAADMPMIANLFTGAANVSSISLEDIGSSMKTVAPVAAAMGISIQQVTAAIAELGNQGIKGSEAGTALRGILASLADPSKESAKLIKTLGLNFRDAQGGMKDFGGIAEELKVKLGGLTQAQREQAIVQLFGRENLAAILALMSEGQKGIDEYTKKIKEQGNAAAAGAARNNNLAGSWQAFQGVIETLTIKLGQQLTPAIKDLVDWTTQGAQAAIPFVTAWGGKLAAALGRTIGIIQALGPAIVQLLRGLATGDFNNAFGPILAAIDAVFGAGTSGKVALFVSNVLTFVQNLRNGVVAFAQGITSGFGAVLGAIASLLTGQTTLAQFVGGMEVFVSTVTGNLGELAGRAAPYLGAFFSAIGTFIANAIPQIVAQLAVWGAAFGTWVSTTAIPALQTALPLLIPAIGSFITGTYIPYFTTLYGPLAKALTDWVLTTAIPYLQTNLPLWLTALGTWVTGTALPAIGTFMLGVATAFTGWITTTAIPYLQTNLPLWLTALSDWITGTALPAIGTAVASIGSAFGGWITTTAIPFVQTNLPLWLAAISDWITATALPAITTALVGVGTAFGDWVATKAVPWVQANLPGWLAAIADWITGTALPAIGTATEKLGEALGNWITTKAIPFLEQNMPVWGATIVHWVDTAKDSIQAGLDQLGKAMGDWVKTTAIPAVEADLPGWIAAIANAVDQANAIVGPGTETLGQTMGKWISTHAIPFLTSDFAQMLGLIGLNIATMGTMITSQAPALAKAISDWAGEPAHAALLNNLNNLANTISQWILTWTFILPILAFNLGKGLMQGMLDGLNATWPSVEAFFSGIPGKITGAIGDTGFLSSVGSAIVQGLIDGINSMSPGLIGAATALANTIKGILQGALETHSPSRVTMRIGAMVGEGLIVGLASTQADVGNTARDLGHALIGGLGTAIDKDTADLQKKLADTASAVAKAITDTLGALSALSSFDFAKNSPSGATLGWFSFLTTSLVATIVDAAAAFKSEALKAAGEFADAAGKVSAFIKTALDAFAALASYDFAKGSPTGGALGWFRFLVESLVATIAQAADGFDTVALKAASDFADAAGKVTGFVKGALDAFAGLGKYAPPAVANIYAFGKTLRSLMNDFALVAEQVTQQAADAAGKFAVAIGPVVDVVGKGLDAFTRLVAWVAPPAAAIYAFGKTLRAALNDFALVAEQVTQGAADAAGKFASAIGPVVDTMGKGVAAFLLLGTYTDPPAAAIYAFGKTLRAVINDLALVAEQVTQDAADAAAKFATSAGSVVGIFGNAIKGFTDLLTFVAPSQAAIDNFAFAVREMVAKFADLASTISTDGLKNADALGGAAGTIFAALKNALDVFTGLAKLVVPSALAIDQFGIAVAYTVAKIGSLADQIGKDGIERATKFGQSMQTIFGSLKSSMDVLTNLAKFKDEASKAFDSLQKGLQAAIDLAQGMVNQSKDMVLLAEEYAANMKKAAALFASGQTLGGMSPEQAGRKLGEGVIAGAREAVGAHSPAEELALLGRDITAGLVMGMTQTQQDAVKAAADLASSVAKAIQDTLGAATALGKLDVATLPGAGQVTGLLAFTRALVAEMAASATLLSEDGAKATTLFADTASKVASAVSGAIGALTGLVTFVAPADSAIFAFGKSLRVAIGDINALAEEIAPAIVQAAATFSEGAAKALGIFGSSVAGIASVLGFTFTKQLEAGVFAFGKAVRVIVGDFNYLAEELGTGLAEAAGKFAEGSGKVLGILSAGVKGFADLLGFAYTDQLAAGIYAFGKAVKAIVRDFAYLADEYGTALADAAGKWADGAGRVLAIVANGVAAFKALPEMVAPAAGQIAIFVGAVAELVRAVEGAARLFGTEGLKAAGDFADTAGKALALLGNAKAFEALTDFKRPADASVGAFVATVRDLVKRMVGLGAEFKADMLKAAGDFADTGGKSVSLVGAAIGGFAGLATFVTPGRAAVDGLLATVKYIIARFGEMAKEMSTEGTKQLGDFGAATNAVLGGVKSAIDTFIALDKAVVPRTGDLSDLVVAVQGVTRNMAKAAAELGDKAIADATAFGTAANGIFTALKAGLDLFIQIDKPGGWPTTDWLQPLIELMSGVLSRGGLLLTQAQQLESIAAQFAASVGRAMAAFGSGWAMAAGGALPDGGGLATGSGLIPVTGGGGGGGGNTYVTVYVDSHGNTNLSDDYATAAKLADILAPELRRRLGIST